MKSILVQYVSEWEEVEDGSNTIVTNAKLDLTTGILEIEASDLDCDGYIDEYVIINGQKYLSETDSHNNFKLTDDELIRLKKELESSEIMKKLSEDLKKMK